MLFIFIYYSFLLSFIIQIQNQHTDNFKKVTFNLLAVIKKQLKNIPLSTKKHVNVLDNMWQYKDRQQRQSNCSKWGKTLMNR